MNHFDGFFKCADLQLSFIKRYFTKLMNKNLRLMFKNIPYCHPYIKYYDNEIINMHDGLILSLGTSELKFKPHKICPRDIYSNKMQIPVGLKSARCKKWAKDCQSTNANIAHQTMCVFSPKALFRIWNMAIQTNKHFVSSQTGLQAKILFPRRNQISPLVALSPNSFFLALFIWLHCRGR